ncbi:hypothetical protein [Streptomyces sp. NPDC056670]
MRLARDNHAYGELPYPRGTLVRDTVSKRTGLLTGVVKERLK